MPASLNSKRYRTLARWTEMLQRRLPTLSLPQAKGLALWSIGIVLARSCSLHAVVLALACWLPFNALSLRKRLQEWYLEASAKKGHGAAGTGYQRRDWDPHATAAELLAWILDDWPTRQVVLALDPTNISDRFTVLNVSVLYRSCAVPVIWTVVEGGKPGAWEPHWERMLETLARQVPPGWQVLVLTDRGMYSPSLFRCLLRLHWHPFLRIRAQGFYRPVGSRKWLKLADLRLPVEQAWSCQADVFNNDAGRLRCTLVGFHGEGHAESWLIVTDLLPELAQASWYGLRGWIEQGYKRVKGEGWHLPRSRISSCRRLERLWLAVAVATMWVLEVGGEAEEAEKAAHKQAKGRQSKKAGADTPELPDLAPISAEQGKAAQKATAESPRRMWSVFSRGWDVLRNALAVGLLLLGNWLPEPWPNHPVQGLPPTPAAVAVGVGRAGPQARQPATTCASDVDHKRDSG
jgi:hypothetical protein